MKLSTDGLIYRLATYFDGDDPTNFCELCRALCFRFFMLCLLCVSAGAFLGDLLATLLVYVTEFYFFMSWSVTFLCGLLGVCLFFVFIYFIDSQSDKSESLRFIKTFYSSKKNKFCPSIELE